MQRTFARMKTLVLGALPLVLAAGIASGQEPAARDLDAELATAREQASQYSDPQSLDQERWQSAFDARIRVLQDLIRLRSDAAGVPDVETIPARQQAADARLDSLRALDGPDPVRLDDPEQLAEFERDLRERQAARDATASAVNDLAARIQRERDERAALQGRSTEVQGRIAALEGEAPVDAHRRATWQMELDYIAQRLGYLAEAMPVWEALGPVLEAEKAAAALMYDHARARATEAREQAAGLREQDVQEQLREAESRAQQADATEDPLESLRLKLESEAASATARTSLTRSEATRIADQLTTEKDLLAGQQTMRDRLEERVKLGAGRSEGALRRVVRRIREGRARIEGVGRPLIEERLERNQAELAQVLDRIWVLQMPESGNETLSALEAAAGEGQEDEARRIFDQLTRGEDGLLPALRGQQDALGDAIRLDSEILAVLDQQLELLADMQVSVRQALLWSRSLPPFSLDAVSVAASEIASLSGFTTTIDIPASMRERARFTLLTIATILAGIAISIWGRRWKIPVPDGDETWVPRYDMAFMQRLARGLAWAGGLSLAAWMVAHWLDTAVGGGDRAPLALLFWGVGWFLLIERSVALTLDPGGFLSHQLRSSRAAAQKTLRGVQLLTSSGIVLLAPAMVTVEPPYNWERIPQLLTIGWMAMFGLIFARTLANSSPVVTEWTQPQSPSRRLLTALGLLVPAVSFLLIAFDLLGFRAGAEALFGNLIRLVAALLILLLLYRVIEGTSARISLAVSRRIIRERGWKEAAEAESKIDGFLRRTAATVVIVLAAIVLREVWGIGDTLSEILARLELFDAGEGDWVTMMDVLDAIILLVLGIVLSQALTKTWELVIAPLRGTEVAGSEYATLTMLRYIVLALAVAAALVTMKFNLARLGWLLTALSVGLGFGLQEIVANFVSGLILMIERPVRVGDVVTVGTTAGVVDKISIRATMVTNWDRQTIVVPNRNFITQEVTNWTRQDRIVRRTLKLGVAYGTDVERVLEILDELVGAHPKVLRNPPHRIWFQGFGESALSFEMWFYASFDDGLTARSELYAQTYARLNEEGIQIPFPQRDVWLRTQAEEPAGEMPDVPDPEDPVE